MADYLDPTLIVETFKTRRPDLRLKSAVTLNKLNSLGVITTQSKYDIKWQVDIGGSAARMEAVTDLTTEGTKDQAVPARLDVGHYRLSETFSFLRQDLKQAQSNGVGEVKRLINRTMGDKVLSIVRRLNALLYTGKGSGSKGLTGDGEMIGLNYIASINDTTGARLATLNDAYAGILRSVVPAWDVLSVNNGGTPIALTRKTLLKVEELIFNNEQAFDLILCSPTTATAYNSIFYDIGAAGTLAKATDGSKDFPVVDLGHTGRSYNGIPLTEDPRVPNGVMYFIDSSQLELVQFNMVQNESVVNENDNITTAVTSPEDTYGLQFVLSSLPQANPDSISFSLRVYPQLACYSRKSICVLSDILVT
jgi:hypothetical protein